MKNVYLLLILLHVTHGLDKIWLLRHCDKPDNVRNDCCSNNGYARSNHWHLYFERYFFPLGQNKIKIYTSNFHSSKTNICIHNINHIDDKTCQHSQRMYLTSNYLYNSLNKQNITSIINFDYCVGSYVDMIHNINNITNYTDIIIVWEHQEIVDIINYFNIKIDKWPHKLEDNYDIIFMIDLQTNKLYYDFFDYKNNIIIHNQNIDNWLTNISTIHSYYNYFSEQNNFNIICIIINLCYSIICVIFILHIIKLCTYLCDDSKWINESSSIKQSSYYTFSDV